MRIGYAREIKHGTEIENMEETKNREDIGERSAERTSRFEVQVEDVSGPGP